MPSYSPPSDYLTSPIDLDPRTRNHNPLGNRLARYYRSGGRGINIYRDSNGNYTLTQPALAADIDRVFEGGHLHPVTTAERAAIEASGVGGTFQDFDARLIPGVYANFDASAITGLNDGDNVSAWYDKIDTIKAPLTQATTSKQPTYHTNVANGLPVVRFDGVDDYLSGLLPSAITVPLTFFVVLNDQGVGNHAPLSILDATPSRGFEAVSTTTAAEFAVLRTVNAADLVAASRSSDLRIWTGQVDTTGEVTTKVNGVRTVVTHSFSATAKALFATQPPSAARIAIGAQDFAGAQTLFHNGDIAEIVIVARSMSDSEISATHSDLAAKWGVTL